MERQEQGTDRKKRIELLAPAGNREAFYGAVHAGADAIYMGGERFGARAYADNFSREELLGCIRYGHLYGCKSYLTVNTLMKEQELTELVEELEPLYQAGLDGVIVQDLGALQVIRRHFPELELHASTQMTVTGPRERRCFRNWECPGWCPPGNSLWKNLKISNVKADWKWRHLFTEPCAIVIPAHVCSAVFWAAAAATGDDAPSPAGCPMRQRAPAGPYTEKNITH